MAGRQDPAGFPAAPWRLRGAAWVGLFRADRPATLPVGLRPFVSNRLVVVALVRYLEGTLCYDELIICRPLWHGWRPGVWVEYIWVNSKASLAGGRQIWALPKEMATFSWQGDQVTVRDEQGLIASVRANQRDGWWPAVQICHPHVGQMPQTSRPRSFIFLGLTQGVGALRNAKARKMRPTTGRHAPIIALYMGSPPLIGKIGTL